MVRPTFDISGVTADLRYALRSWRRRPGLSVTLVCTLGLGLGLGAAIFSFADGYLFRPLPFPSPEQLYRLRDPHAPIALVVSVAPAFAGLLIGSGSAWALARFVGANAFGWASSGLTAMAVVSVSLIAVAIIAAVGPARRVLRIDPSIVLRAE